MVCPSDEQLLAFHLGELADAQIQSVGEHLVACTRCELQSVQLDAMSDPVLSALRRSNDTGVGFTATRSHVGYPLPSFRTGAMPDIPDYEMLGFLGKGGMGVVYKARHRRLDRLVALKCLYSDGAAELDRFQAEAQAVARLQHPNIVQIFEVGEWQGQPFLTLEFLDGGTLADHLSGKPQDARASAALVQTLAQAVHYAHTQGIVHRDLKPANVLLQIADVRLKIADLQDEAIEARHSSAISHLQSALPKIADFGIAKHMHASGQTREGDIIGTARYMAPEQAVGKGAAIGPASDIYSLGVILYELLTGRVPLQGATDLETVLMLQTAEPVPPRRLQPSLPRDLETICLKCLHKEPAARYATADALALDLGRHLSGEPIAARPTANWERAWKWTKRRPALAVVVALAAFIVCIGFPTTTYLWMQADSARAEESEQRQKAEAAATAETLAKQIAEAREADTVAVLDFVQGRVFAAARPEGQDGGLGREVTLRQAIEMSLPYVEQGFAKQPLIEARLRLVLGKTYLQLGDAAIAAEQFQTARALLIKHLGPDDPDTLRCANQLAISYYRLGKHVEADKLHNETIATQSAKLGPDHPDTLLSLTNLANNYAQLNRHAEARKLMEKTLALQEASLGRGHPDMLENMHNLAATYFALGLREESLKLDLETLERRRTLLGPSHPDTLHSMNNVAVSYAAQGRNEDAFKLDLETVELRKAKIGPNHPETLRSMHNLAISYATLGRHVEAQEIREETLARRRVKLGSDHPDTLWSMWSTAAGFVKLDRGAEAVPLIDECVKFSAGKVVNPRMIPQVIDMRMRHFAKAKDGAGCRTTAEMWEKQNRTDVASVYRAATMRAIAAAVIINNDKMASAAEADRAMAWLRKAVDIGFRDVAHLRQNKDFGVLRDRDDFKELQAELEAGKAIK